MAASGAIDSFRFSTVSGLVLAFSMAFSVSANLAIISLAVFSNSCTLSCKELEFGSTAADGVDVFVNLLSCKVLGLLDFFGLSIRLWKMEIFGGGFD